MEVQAPARTGPPRSQASPNLRRIVAAGPVPAKAEIYPDFSVEPVPDIPYAEPMNSATTSLCDRILRKLYRMLEHAQQPLRRHAAKTMADSQRLEQIRSLSADIMPEYRFQWPQLDWIQNREFNEYLALFGETRQMDTHRRWMLYQLLRLVAPVEGDTAECGVFRGCGSWLILLEAKRAKRMHHIFDSFEGLSAPLREDGAHWKKGDLSAPETVVAQNLASFEGYFKLHRGWIPERFPEVGDRRFAFVHIDVDLKDPTLESLRFFYPRLARGGVLVCDDYGFASCPGATRAIDEYLADKPEKMMALPQGGGFMIRGQATGLALDLQAGLARSSAPPAQP